MFTILNFDNFSQVRYFLSSLCLLFNLWVMRLIWIIFKYLVLTLQRALSVSAINTNKLMSSDVPTSSQIQAKHINKRKVCGNVWCFRRVSRSLKSTPISFVVSARPSFRPHISARLPLDEFPWNFMLETFMKIRPENPNLDKIGQNIWNYTWRTTCDLLSPATLYRHKSALFEWNGIGLLG